MTPAALSRAQSDATRRARGELGYPSPGVREIGNLRGAPVRESLLLYAPIDDIPAIKGCAILIIDAEKEELFDAREQGELAFARAAEPRNSGDPRHYTLRDLHRRTRAASGLAIEWMDQYLKGGTDVPDHKSIVRSPVSLCPSLRQCVACSRLPGKDRPAKNCTPRLAIPTGC